MMHACFKYIIFTFLLCNFIGGRGVAKLHGHELAIYAYNISTYNISLHNPILNLFK